MGKVAIAFKGDVSNRGLLSQLFLSFLLFRIILFRFLENTSLDILHSMIFFKIFLLSVSVWLCLAYSMSHGAANRPTNQSGFPSNRLETLSYFLAITLIITHWMCLLALAFEERLVASLCFCFSISFYLFSVLFDESQIRERWFDHRSN